MVPAETSLGDVSTGSARCKTTANVSTGLKCRMFRRRACRYTWKHFCRFSQHQTRRNILCDRAPVETKPTRFHNIGPVETFSRRRLETRRNIWNVSSSRQCQTRGNIPRIFKKLMPDPWKHYETWKHLMMFRRVAHRRYVETFSGAETWKHLHTKGEEGSVADTWKHFRNVPTVLNPCECPRGCKRRNSKTPRA